MLACVVKTWEIPVVSLEKSVEIRMPGAIFWCQAWKKTEKTGADDGETACGRCGQDTPLISLWLKIALYHKRGSALMEKIISMT